MPTCKTCKWPDVEPNKTGRIAVYKRSVYRCILPDPGCPSLPDSILKYYDFKWPPKRTRMQGKDGETCTFHEPRKSNALKG